MLSSEVRFYSSRHGWKEERISEFDSDHANLCYLPTAGSNSFKYRCSKGTLWFSRDQKRWYQGPYTSKIYCQNCFDIAYEGRWDIIDEKLQLREFTLQFEDGAAPPWWPRCKPCEIDAKRWRGVRTWSKALDLCCEWNKDIHGYAVRFMTLTTKDPTFAASELFSDWRLELNAPGTYHQKWMNLHTRPYRRNGKLFHKITCEWNDKIDHLARTWCTKLKGRWKRLKQRNKRFKKHVEGGIVCFEMTLRIDPDTMMVSIHPHLHAVVVGTFYPNTRDKPHLTEDWGIGFCDIRPVNDELGLRHEITKYIGKDKYARRAAHGIVREARRYLKTMEE